MATSYSSSSSNKDQNESLRPYVESIDLYKKYVLDTLAPRLMEWLYEYWVQTQDKLAKERFVEGPYADLVAYQEALQRVTEWDDERIALFMKGLFGEDHVQDAKSKLRTALSRIVAANTALLAAAAPREMQQNLEVQTPAPSFFVHESLIAVAAYLYRHPDLVKRGDDDLLMALLERTIESEVRKLTPYDKILSDSVDSGDSGVAAVASAQPANPDHPVDPTNPAVDQPAAPEPLPGPAEISVHDPGAQPDVAQPEVHDEVAQAGMPLADDDTSGSDDDDANQSYSAPPPPVRSKQPQSSNRSRYARQAP